MEYREWEREVNKLMLKNHGVGIDDIPDMPYNTWYLDYRTVEETVELAISIVNEGGF